MPGSVIKRPIPYVLPHNSPHVSPQKLDLDDDMSVADLRIADTVGEERENESPLSILSFSS